MAILWDSNKELLSQRRGQMVVFILMIDGYKIRELGRVHHSVLRIPDNAQKVRDAFRATVAAYVPPLQPVTQRLWSPRNWWRRVYEPFA